MAGVVELDECSPEISDDNNYPRRRPRGADCGGSVEDILKRLGAVESSISEIKVQTAVIPQLATKSDVAELKGEISAINARIPQFATKSDLAELKAEISAVLSVIPTLATKSELGELKAQISALTAVIPHLATKADISGIETKIIKWIIATVITSFGVAFSIAKFVH